MTYIMWKDSFSVGVEEMDDQHKQFIGYINDLYESMQSGNKESLVDTTLNKLTDYIKVHFAAEEKLLKSINYSRLEIQIKQHAYYISEIASLKNTYMKNTQTAQNMLLFLKDWFINHIATEDQKYIEFV